MMKNVSNPYINCSAKINIIELPADENEIWQEDCLSCMTAEVKRPSFPRGSHLSQSLRYCCSVIFLNGVLQDQSTHQDIIYGPEIGRLIKITHYFWCTTNSLLKWGISIKSIQLGLILSIQKNSKDFRTSARGLNLGKKWMQKLGKMPLLDSFKF